MRDRSESQGEERLDVYKLTWIIVLGLALRFIWASLIYVEPISDSHAYDTFARNLLDHGFYGWDKPFAFWPPGTSFLYAAVYGVFGEHFYNIVVLNIIMTAALIIVSTRVAARFYSNRIALVAASILAVWPTWVMFTTILASELPFLLLTIAALDVWSQRDRSLMYRGIVTGVLLGAAALVRPLAMALPFIYGASMCLGMKDKALAQARLVLLSAVVMCCVISPWALRNYRIYNDVVLVSTNGGITLWMGNSPGSNGGYAEIPARLSGLNDNEQSKILGDEAKKYIISDPVGFALRTMRKVVQLYNNESIGVIWNAQGIEDRFGAGAVTVLKRFTQLSWAIIFLMACFGAVILVSSHGWRALASPVIGSIIFYSVAHSVIVSQDRYHLVFAAQLAILAGVLLARAPFQIFGTKFFIPSSKT